MKSPQWWSWRMFEDMNTFFGKSFDDNESVNFDSNGNLTVAARKDKVYHRGKDSDDICYYKTLDLKDVCDAAVNSNKSFGDELCSWSDMKKYLKDIPEQMCSTFKLNRPGESTSFEIANPANGKPIYRVVVSRIGRADQFGKSIFGTGEALQIRVGKLGGAFYGADTIGEVEWNFGDDRIHFLMAENGESGNEEFKQTMNLDGELILRKMLEHMGYHAGKVNMAQ